MKPAPNNAKNAKKNPMDLREKNELAVAHVKIWSIVVVIAGTLTFITAIYNFISTNDIKVFGKFLIPMPLFIWIWFRLKKRKENLETHQ